MKPLTMKQLLKQINDANDARRKLEARVETLEQAAKQAAADAGRGNVSSAGGVDSIADTTSAPPPAQTTVETDAPPLYGKYDAHPLPSEAKASPATTPAELEAVANECQKSANTFSQNTQQGRMASKMWDSYASTIRRFAAEVTELRKQLDASRETTKTFQQKYEEAYIDVNKLREQCTILEVELDDAKASERAAQKGARINAEINRSQAAQLLAISEPARKLAEAASEWGKVKELRDEKEWYAKWQVAGEYSTTQIFGRLAAPVLAALNAKEGGGQ